MDSKPMIQIRLLNADEFALLDSVPEPDKAALKPENSIVAVATLEGKLIGRIAAVSLPHIECVWIMPVYRGGVLLGRLEKVLECELKTRGATLAMAFAVNEQMENYCRRLGFQRFASAWRKDI